MGRRKNTAYKSARMPVTRGLALRSRVPGNWHARFCSRGGESDFLIDCNPTPTASAPASLRLLARLTAGVRVRPLTVQQIVLAKNHTWTTV